MVIVAGVCGDGDGDGIDDLPGSVSVGPDHAAQTMALRLDDDGQIVAVYMARNPDELGRVQALLPPLIGGHTTSTARPHERPRRD